MTALLPEAPTLPPADPTAAVVTAGADECPVWCLGRCHHEEAGLDECVSAAVRLAPGMIAWVRRPLNGSAEVTVVGEARELGADELRTLMRRLAGLWALLT